MNICLIAILGTGLLCSGGDKAGTVSEYCQTARIIIASRHDTAETLKQIRAENAKIRKLCPKSN